MASGGRVSSSYQVLDTLRASALEARREHLRGHFGGASHPLVSHPSCRVPPRYFSLSPSSASHRLCDTALNRTPAKVLEGYLIPPPRAVNEGKLVVVLDLDETLVYSREGPIVARPGVRRLLDVLRGRCEVVVWTAGEKHYAREVIRMIDPFCCIEHCVYRHRKWWSEGPGSVKDISALGRPLKRTLLIDNTPDCLRANPRNGILVTDFRGDKGGVVSPIDSTLYTVADVIDNILRGVDISVEALRRQPQLALRRVMCDSGGHVDVFTLRRDNYEEQMPPMLHQEGMRTLTW